MIDFMDDPFYYNPYEQDDDLQHGDREWEKDCE